MNDRHFPSFAFRNFHILSHGNGYVTGTIHSELCEHGVSGRSIAYFRMLKLFYIHGMKRQLRNLQAHSGYLRRSGGTSIDFLSIYEDHNLPSVVTRHLACITIQPIRYILIHWWACLSRPVTRDSLLKRHKSRSRVARSDLWRVRHSWIKTSSESRIASDGSRIACSESASRYSWLNKSFLNGWPYSRVTDLECETRILLRML